MSDSQPLLITDQDVLTQLDNDDAIEAAMDAALAAVSAKVPASVAASWASDKAAYLAWAPDARSKVEGGFFAGAWFGVPDLYRYAVDWGHTLSAYSTAVTAAGGTSPPLPALPPQSSPVSNPLSSSGAVGLGTGLALGLGGAALLVLLLRR